MSSVSETSFSSSGFIPPLGGSDGKAPLGRWFSRFSAGRVIVLTAVAGMVGALCYRFFKSSANKSSESTPSEDSDLLGISSEGDSSDRSDDTTLGKVRFAKRVSYGSLRMEECGEGDAWTPYEKNPC